MGCHICRVTGHKCTCKSNMPMGCVAHSPADIQSPSPRAYQAPGDRAPIQTDAIYSRRPGTPSHGVEPGMSGGRDVTRPTNLIGPTDALNPFPRAAAEGGRIRWVREQWCQKGGPAYTAPNQPGWGWVHNYGYITIADTLKPAQQLPRYTYSSVDTTTVLDRARNAVMRALYGGGK